MGEEGGCSAARSRQGRGAYRGPAEALFGRNGASEPACAPDFRPRPLRNRKKPPPNPDTDSGAVWFELLWGKRGAQPTEPDAEALPLADPEADVLPLEEPETPASALKMGSSSS